MARNKSKKQVVAKAKRNAVKAPVPELKKMDAKQRAFIAEYANSLDTETACDVADIPPEEREAFLAHDKIVGMMTNIDNLSLIAVDWNKAKATANAVKLTNVLMEQVEMGEMKAANALQRMVELGLTSHGLGKKANESDAPKISVNINLQTNETPEVKVVNGETENS